MEFCGEKAESVDIDDSMEPKSLDMLTVSSGLSNLGWSAEGTHQVYLHLILPGCCLCDVSILESYIHLQKIDLSFNKITELSVLGNMPYLLDLNASHNCLTDLLDFAPPKNLKVVNMSFNQITTIPDLCAHRHLQRLCLDNNYIKVIQGLENCKRLTHLSLQHNEIERIQCLDGLPIKYLNLAKNCLTMIENLESLTHLQKIDLSGNKIRSLTGLQRHHFLETIDLEENEVIDIAEIEHIQGLDQLRRVNLRRNPVCELPDYRLAVLFNVPQLTDLDHQPATVEEKIDAVNLFNPSKEYIAARDHIMHLVYSFLQPNRLLEITLPVPDTPYPMLILVGPVGMGKNSIALKLVEEFPDYFGFAPSHTTRLPHIDEEPGRDYYFVPVEEFEEGIKRGMFLQTYSYHGELYGLSLDAVEAVATESLACIAHMELEGVLTLKNSYLEPRYVLVLPVNECALERRLLEKGCYNDLQIKDILTRSEMYAEYNRTHPGFFDVAISSDDITETYRKVRLLVMEYLGISTSQSAASSTLEPGLTDLSLGVDQCATRLSMSSTTGEHSAPLLKRSWSRPSIIDSADKTRSKVAKIRMVGSAPARGIVEEESWKRRQSAAMEIVSGHPPLFEQLTNRAACSVPPPPHNPDNCETQRFFSAPTAKLNLDDVSLPVSPDSSDAALSKSSSLSSNRSAPEMVIRKSTAINKLDSLGEADSNIVIDSTSFRDIELPYGMTRLRQESAPPILIGSKTNLQSILRPGSGKLLVLPPITNIKESAFS